jgi:hypothetical protein
MKSRAVRTQLLRHIADKKAVKLTEADKVFRQHGFQPRAWNVFEDAEFDLITGGLAVGELLPTDSLHQVRQ